LDVYDVVGVENIQPLQKMLLPPWGIEGAAKHQTFASLAWPKYTYVCNSP